MTTGSYEARPLVLSEDELRDCENLLRRAFPQATYLTREYLDWQYNANPAGRAIGFNAYQGSVLAAHYVTIPWIGRLGGETTRGVLSLNTATHPDHQGKKLFTMLAEKTYEAAAARGYSFVVGVGNANSTPGLVRKLGFQLVGPLEARLGFGRPVREEPAAPAGFEKIWGRETLVWRLRNPARPYGLVSDGARFRVEASTDTPGIKALLGEFDADWKPEGAGASLGFRPFTLWMGIDDGIRWSRSLFWRIPTSLRRSPLNLVFKPLRAAEPLLERDDVRFGALDFDPY